MYTPERAFYPHSDSGTNAAHTGQTYFITSRSDGSSAEMSAVSFSRWREDMSGKGAELSRPKMERMSCRMLSTPAWRSLGEVCSLNRAGMLFCPRYLVTSADSGSTEIGVRDVESLRFERNGIPKARMAGSDLASLLSSRVSWSSGERALFLLMCEVTSEPPVDLDDRFGL